MSRLLLAAVLVLSVATAAGECPPLPIPPSATITSCPPTIATGVTCVAACKAGYEAVPNTAASRQCQADGSWTGAPLQCMDINACATLPCNGDVSTCQDRAAPQLGHDCVCLPGFEGQPGADGTGCRRAPEIVSEDDNLRAIVGPFNSIKFEIGSTVIDAKQISANAGAIDSLRNLLSDLETNKVDKNAADVALLRSDVDNTMATLADEFEKLNNQTNVRLDKLINDQAAFEASLNQAVDAASSAAGLARDQISQDLQSALNDLASQSQDQHTGHFSNFSTVFLTLADLEANKADKAWVTDRQGKLPDETALQTCDSAHEGYLRFHKAKQLVQVCKTDGWSAISSVLGTQENPASSCAHLAADNFKSDGLYYINNHQEYCRLSQPGQVISLGGDGTTEAAAAHSCRTIMDLHKKIDGSDVRWLRNQAGDTYQTRCDFLRNGGGWTLVVQSANNNWTPEQVQARNEKAYAADDDYSILKYADGVKNHAGISAHDFEYRLEAGTPGRYGGVFRVPRHYTFTSEDNSQTNVELVEGFDGLVFKDIGVERRMPWTPLASCSGTCGLLTTSTLHATQWHGTIVQKGGSYNPAPWIAGDNLNPGTIWYWMREGPVVANGPQDVGTFGNPASDCSQILSVHRRSGLYYMASSAGPYPAFCHAGQMISGDGTDKARPARSCRFVKEQFAPHFGVDLRWIQVGSEVFQTFCDFDKGGFMLLVTVKSGGWSKDNRLARGTPNLDDNFSILGRADSIKNLVHRPFEYMIEAFQRGRFGGVWSAPPEYTFVKEDNTQTSITLTEKFDDWNYDDDGVEARMPWLGASCGLLTTSGAHCSAWWGTIITDQTSWYPSPWMNSNDAVVNVPVQGEKPGVIWYWMREGSTDY